MAQRINTILDADQIIVLDEGRIVGKGTHRDLMENCRVYQEIARSQLSEEELERYRIRKRAEADPAGGTASIGESVPAGDSALIGESVPAGDSVTTEDSVQTSDSILTGDSAAAERGWQ